MTRGILKHSPMWFGPQQVVSGESGAALLRHKLLLLGVLIAAGGCYKAQDSAEQGLYDFTNTPVSYQVVSSVRAPEEMLPSQKSYEFRTCLKDRVSLRTLALSEFAVDGEVYLSDEEGCVVWNQRVEFNPYLQSQIIEDEFEIIGRGKTPGRLVIPYKLNPWSGIRPTSTAEFVEIFPTSATAAVRKLQEEVPPAAGEEDASSELTQDGADDEAADDEPVRKKAFLTVRAVKKNVFFHNESSRAERGHWNFEITPLLQVYDVREVQHALIPQNGQVSLTLEILSLPKNLTLEARHIEQARLMKKLSIEDQQITSGKIYVSEKVRIPQVLEGNNILLRVSLKGDSQLMGKGLESHSKLFFVRQTDDVEELQEVDLSEHVPGVKEVVVQPEGGVHPYYYAENPHVSFVRALKRATTQATYELLLRTRLIHRSTSAVVHNEELYVTYGEETKTVRVLSDGIIHFPFNFEYDFYRMMQKPQEVVFVITNKEKSLAVKLPLFLKPWEYGGNMALNPEALPAKTVEQLRTVSFERPQIYLDSLSLNPPTYIDYDVAQDLSLGFKYGYVFHGTAKIRSLARETFGGPRVMDAPDGRYRLDAYLSCPAEGLKNRQRYNVTVDDDLSQVRINWIKDDPRRKPLPQYLAVEANLKGKQVNWGESTEWGSTEDRKSFCPVSHTSFDVEVEDGNLSGMFRLDVPDPRMEWTRNQLTVVLTPYDTEHLSSTVAHTQKLQLSKIVDPAPMAAMVVLESFSKKQGTIKLEDIRKSEEGHHKRMKSLEEVQLGAQKWQVLHPYTTYLSSLESDYLADLNLQYVSLENRPYSALPQKAAQQNSWDCAVGSPECLMGSSDTYSLSYRDFQKRFLEPRNWKLTDHEMRKILWNDADSRIDDLVGYACSMYLTLFYEALERHFGDPKSVIRHYGKSVAVTEVYRAYGDLIQVIHAKFTRISEECRRVSSQRMNSIQDWTHRSVVAVHHLKGEVNRVFPQDAGVDILHYRHNQASGISNGLALYASMHTDLLGVIGAIFKSMGAASVVGYSVSSTGEFEITTDDQMGGGMTHYSNWATLQLALEFPQPKYCLTLRMDPDFFLGKFSTLPAFHIYNRLIGAEVNYDAEFAMDWYQDLLESLTTGFLFCTEQQPDLTPVVTAQGEKIQPPVIGIEHYRFPAPRFVKPGVFDPTLETFRDWLYPLRGQSDYLKFIYSVSDLNENKGPTYFDPRSDLFQASNKFTSWVFEDEKVKGVQDDLFPTAQEFIKFPKQFVYDRFSAVPPAVGGFYSY